MDKNTQDDLSTEIFKMDYGGYGYQIKLNNQVRINQEIIPAISMNVPFKTEIDAQKTAELVVQKIKYKKVPSVTIEELDSLHIKY